MFRGANLRLDGERWVRLVEMPALRADDEDQVEDVLPRGGQAPAQRHRLQLSRLRQVLLDAQSFVHPQVQIPQRGH